jgi:hypothetical protein
LALQQRKTRNLDELLGEERGRTKAYGMAQPARALKFQAFLAMEFLLFSFSTFQGLSV